MMDINGKMSTLHDVRYESSSNDNDKNIDVIHKNLVDDLNKTNDNYDYTYQDATLELENERNISLNDKNHRQSEIGAEVSAINSGKIQKEILQNTEGHKDDAIYINNSDNEYSEDSNRNLKNEHSSESNYKNILDDKNKLIIKKTLNGYHVLDYENKSFENDDKIVAGKNNQQIQSLNFDNANPRNEKIRAADIDQVVREDTTSLDDNNVMRKSCESDNKITIPDNNDVIAEVSADIVALSKQEQTNCKNKENCCDENLVTNKIHQPELYALLQTNNSSSWPDLDQLVRLEVSNNSVLDQDSVASLSEIIVHETELVHQKPLPANEKDDQSPAWYSENKRMENSKKSSQVNVTSGMSSARALKSILLNNKCVSQCSCAPSCQHNTKSRSEIHESKSIKFSENTVFNENKFNKYKQERIEKINFRELYQGQTGGDLTVIEGNLLYVEDNSKLESMSEDKKIAYQIALKKILKSPKMNDADIDKQLPEMTRRSAYDQRMERTLAKERQKCCIRWTFVILTVVITALVTTLGIYLKHGL